MRDIFGRLIKTDIMGRKIPKKQLKREVLEENRRRGKAAKQLYETRAFIRGKELERKHHGRDYIERTRDPFTGRVQRTTHVEIKSSPTAPLSKLQKEAKRKNSRYKVERINPLF
jgi:hypothetical protein